MQRAGLKETAPERQLKVAKFQSQGLVERGEREKAEREAKHGARREKRRGRGERDRKSPAPTVLSTWVSTVEKDDPPEKASSLSFKEREKERGGGRGVGSTGKKGRTSALLPIDPSIVPADLPGGGEATSFTVEVELRAPEEDKDIYTPSDFSVVSSPVISSRAVVCSENERFTDAEQPSLPQSPRPTLVQRPVPEASSNFTSESVGVPQAIREEAPTTLKPWPTPYLTRPPAPANTSTKDEPDGPLSWWERKKSKTTPVPGVSSSYNAKSPLGVWRGVAGGAERAATPTLTRSGDRQSVFTHTARDQKRKNQGENTVEGFPGPSQRRKNDSAQSQVAATPVPRPVPTPKSSGWWPWEESTRSVTDDRDRSSSPEPAVVKPKDDLSEPARNQLPPKSLPAGFGSSNKPIWGGAGGSAWGDAKNVSTPRTQRMPSGPAWGAKPGAGGWFESISEIV